jgi:hypothetical protein
MEEIRGQLGVNACCLTLHLQFGQTFDNATYYKIKVVCIMLLASIVGLILCCGYGRRQVSAGRELCSRTLMMLLVMNHDEDICIVLYSALDSLQ